MIAILGDPHFSSIKPYLVKVGDCILNWLRTWAFNKPGNELVIAGDLIHSAINGGTVLRQIQLLVEYSQFDRIHIIPGNHDIKWREGHPQLGYEFLRSNPKVIIYDRITEVTIQDHQFLMMPHYIPDKDEADMISSYSQAFMTYKGPYDCVIGHFMDAEGLLAGAAEAVHNLHKINSKYICLGHVHTKVSPVYIESLYANKINEASDTRAAWIFDNHQKFEDKLPNFLEYVTVKYGDSLPEREALVSIYTFTNCRSESLVKSKYGDIFIRKIVQSLNIDASTPSEITYSIEEKFDIKSCFRSFLKTKPNLDRNLVNLCLSKL